MTLFSRLRIKVDQNSNFILERYFRNLFLLSTVFLFGFVNVSAQDSEVNVPPDDDYSNRSLMTTVRDRYSITVEFINNTDMSAYAYGAIDFSGEGLKDSNGIVKMANYADGTTFNSSVATGSDHVIEAYTTDSITFYFTDIDVLDETSTVGMIFYIENTSGLYEEALYDGDNKQFKIFKGVECSSESTVLMQRYPGTSWPYAKYGWFSFNMNLGELSSIGNSFGTHYNGIGYNSIDGLFYGNRYKSNNLVISAIDLQGDEIDSGEPYINLNISIDDDRLDPENLYSGGDVFDNHLFLKESNSHQLIVIDVDPNSDNYLKVII